MVNLSDEITWFDGINVTFTIPNYEKIAWPTDNNTIDNYEDDCIKITSVNLYESQDLNYDFVGNVLILNSTDLFDKDTLYIACVKKEIALNEAETTYTKFTTLSGKQLTVENFNPNKINLSKIEYNKDGSSVVLTDNVFWKVLSDDEIENYCDFILKKTATSGYTIHFKNEGNYVIPKTSDDISDSDKIQITYKSDDNLVVSLNNSNKEYVELYTNKEDEIKYLFTLSDFCENWRHYYKYTPIDKLLFLKKGFYEFRCYDDDNKEVPGLVKILNTDAELNTYDRNNLVSTSDKINLNDYYISRLENVNWASLKTKKDQIDLLIKDIEEKFDNWYDSGILPTYSENTNIIYKKLGSDLEDIYNHYDVDLDKMSPLTLRSYELDWKEIYEYDSPDSLDPTKQCGDIELLLISNIPMFTFSILNLNKVGLDEDRKYIDFEDKTIEIKAFRARSFMRLSFMYGGSVLCTLLYSLGSSELIRTDFYYGDYNLGNPDCTYDSNVKYTIVGNYEYISIVGGCYVDFGEMSSVTYIKDEIELSNINLTDGKNEKIDFKNGILEIDYSFLDTPYCTVAILGTYSYEDSITTLIRLVYHVNGDSDTFTPISGNSYIKYPLEGESESNLPSIKISNLSDTGCTIKSITIPVKTISEEENVENSVSYNMTRTVSESPTIDYIPKGTYKYGLDISNILQIETLNGEIVNLDFMYDLSMGSIFYIIYQFDDANCLMYEMEVEDTSNDILLNEREVVVKYNDELVDIITIKFGMLYKEARTIEISEPIRLYTLEDFTDDAPKRVELDPKTTSLYVGYVKQINAIVHPSWTEDKTIEWESEDPSIASVDNSGIVTGVSPGTTEIYAKLSGSDVKGVCTVSVVVETNNRSLMWDILKSSVKYKISELENEKNTIIDGKYYTKSKLIDEQIDPENDWIGEFIFIPNDPFLFVKEKDLTFSIVYLNEIEAFNDIKYYNTKQEYVSCPYVHNYYLGSKEQNLKTFLEKGINLSFSAVHISPYFVKGKIEESECKLLTPFINNIPDFNKYNLTTVGNKFMFKYVAGLCLQDRSGQNSEIISKLYCSSSLTNYDCIETQPKEVEKERNVDISEQNQLGSLPTEYNIPLIPVFLYKTGKDKLAKSTVSANDQSVTVISENNTIDVSTNTSLGTIRNKQIYPGSLWGKSINTWIGRYVGLLSNIYKLSEDPSTVTLIDNYAYYDKYSTTFTKDILVSVSPRSIDNCNKYFTIRDFNYIEWLSELNKYRTGIPNNDYNVNILLEGVIKNFPTSFNFSYEIPIINITQLKDPVSKINTVYGTELISKITELDTNKLYTLDKNGDPISLESYPYIPNCENKFIYRDGKITYDGSMPSEILNISDLVISNTLTDGELSLKDLGKYDIITTQRRNWIGKKFDEYLTGLPKNNAFIK